VTEIPAKMAKGATMLLRTRKGKGKQMEEWIWSDKGPELRREGGRRKEAYKETGKRSTPD
jgi:hypothetical protein